MSQKEIKNYNMKKSIRYEDTETPVLEILSFGFYPLSPEVLDPEVEITASSTGNIEARILDTPLFYPSPFRLSDNARLTYTLSKDMDIDLRIYDMRGYQIFKGDFLAGEIGARAGYNTLTFSAATIDNFELSAGIYFFILINDGKVLGRGKFGVKP
ncbi:T9SS type A sorting domain-containing protein [Candidatus Margulisiibacteriota bacterium]